MDQNTRASVRKQSTILLSDHYNVNEATGDVFKTSSVDVRASLKSIPQILASRKPGSVYKHTGPNNVYYFD